MRYDSASSGVSVGRIITSLVLTLKISLTFIFAFVFVSLTALRLLDNCAIFSFSSCSYFSGDKYNFKIKSRSTNEYNNESFIQSNCVKTYVNYPHCVIFSLRKNSPDSEERITIEFNIKKVNNFILLKRTQTLGRFNKPINSEYDEVCKIFDERIKTFLLKNDFILPNVKLLIANKIFDSKIIYSDKSKSFEWGSENFNNILSYGCLTTNFQHHIEHDEVDIF